MENVTNEVTTETAIIEQTPNDIANDVVKTLSATELASYIAELIKDKDAAIESKQLVMNQRDAFRTELNNYKNSVSEFLKEHIKDDAIDVDDLKEFADELGISLTKTIRVKFTIDVEGDFSVPLDFNEDDVTDETDFFTIRIDADPSDDNHEIESEEWNVNDVEAKEV